MTVTDTGAGIAEAKLQLLFEPFERLGADADGDRRHRSRAWRCRAASPKRWAASLGVESVVDRGSTFWVELAQTERRRRRTDARTPIARRRDARTDHARGVVLVHRRQPLERPPHGTRDSSGGPASACCTRPTAERGLAAARTERPRSHSSRPAPARHAGRGSAPSSLAGSRAAQYSGGGPQRGCDRGAVAPAQASGAIAYLTKPLEIRAVLQLDRRSVEPRRRHR